MKPSCAAILALLRERGEAGLTPLSALDEAGCFRLAARVADLKADGYDIRTTMVRSPFRGGRSFALYVLYELDAAVLP